jgi:hypothetical protein
MFEEWSLCTETSDSRDSLETPFTFWEEEYNLTSNYPKVRASKSKDRGDGDDTEESELGRWLLSSTEHYMIKD